MSAPRTKSEELALLVLQLSSKFLGGLSARESDLVLQARDLALQVLAEHVAQEMAAHCEALDAKRGK